MESIELQHAELLLELEKFKLEMYRILIATKQAALIVLNKSAH